jgi:hypothetical protein
MFCIGWLFVFDGYLYLMVTFNSFDSICSLCNGQFNHFIKTVPPARYIISLYATMVVDQ